MTEGKYEPKPGSEVEGTIRGTYKVTEQGRPVIRYAPGLMFSGWIGAHHVHDLRPACLQPEHEDADRAELRRSWAAMSSALVALGEHHAPDEADLALIPQAHRSYLLGHAAMRRSYVDTMDRLRRTLDLVDDAMRGPADAANAGERIPAGDVVDRLFAIRAVLDPRFAAEQQAPDDPAPIVGEG